MTYSTQVQKVMSGEYISSTEMDQMLSQAAITRERGFNRRFHHWLFRVKDGVVERMEYFDLPRFGSGPEIMRETCLACNGGECMNCGWSGVVLRAIKPNAHSGYRPMRLKAA